MSPGLFWFFRELRGKRRCNQFVHFFACPKKRTKERAPCVSCPAAGGIPCAPRCCRGFANSLRSNSANPPFGSLSGARLRANGIFFLPPFVLPRLADGGGKRRGNCLRAKPEFFRVPPSARSKGSPQGQDWLGCLFLVSSFGHAKEEKENSKKASPLSQEFPDEPFFVPEGQWLRHRRSEGGRGPR
jgi:hypothetical protein